MRKQYKHSTTIQMNEKNSIIGGFGASASYLDAFAKRLSVLTKYPVQIFPLIHGLTLDGEVSAILTNPLFSGTTIVIGFSTGSIVAMRLSSIYQINHLILCCPAEINSRTDESFLAYANKSTNIMTHVWSYILALTIIIP